MWHNPSLLLFHLVILLLCFSRSQACLQVLLFPQLLSWTFSLKKSQQVGGCLSKNLFRRDKHGQQAIQWAWKSELGVLSLSTKKLGHPSDKKQFSSRNPKKPIALRPQSAALTAKVLATMLGLGPKLSQSGLLSFVDVSSVLHQGVSVISVVSFVLQSYFPNGFMNGDFRVVLWWFSGGLTCYLVPVTVYNVLC